MNLVYGTQLVRPGRRMLRAQRWRLGSVTRVTLGLELTSLGLLVL